MIVWLNGVIVPMADGRIAPNDRGLTLGDGLFETLRVANGAPLRLNAHLRRLRHGADVLRLALPLSDADLAAALAATIAGNELGQGVLRLTVTRGAGERGLLPPRIPEPTILVTAGALPPPTAPARVVIARVTRRNAGSPLSRIKSLNRLDDVLARMEAAERGVDDALLLNGAGRLTEASAANLFAVLDGVLVTPREADGVLPGTIREILIAQHCAVERTLAPEDLSRAQEVFLTNALGVRPVVAVDGVAVADGAPGGVAASLARCLF